MTPQTLTPRELAHRLVAPETSTADAPDPVPAAASMVCDQLYRELSRWIGADGSDALFARAIARAQVDHPALQDIQFSRRSDSCLEGVAKSVQAHGASAIAEGLESMLVALIELLGRLIGDDMATKLIEQSVPRDTGDAASPPGRRAAP